MSLTDETKLDKIINEWISSETNRRKVFKTLQSLGRKNMLKNAVVYLEKPEIYTVNILQ